MFLRNYSLPVFKGDVEQFRSDLHVRIGDYISNIMREALKLPLDAMSTDDMRRLCANLEKIFNDTSIGWPRKRRANYDDISEITGVIRRFHVPTEGKVIPLKTARKRTKAA